MSKPLATIAYNATVAKLIEPSREIKMEIQNALSYAVEGAEHSTAFKGGGWDGRSSFFEFKNATFPAGFVALAVSALTKSGYKISLVKRPLPDLLGPLVPVVDNFPEDDRYDYQRATVAKLAQHGRMIAQVATGGGKSKIARLAYARISRPTLFLTTRSILMYQMKESFERDMKIPCSVLGDGQFGRVDAEGNTKVGKLCVGMVQTLISRLQTPDSSKNKAHQAKQALIRQQTINLLSQFEFVIGEEAHEASGNGYYEILKYCKNAYYRLALTATPFMKDGEESNMRLMGCFGPIGVRVSEKLLIDRQILAKPIFKYVQLTERPVGLFRSTPWQAAYRLGIVGDESRNRHIVFEAARAAKHGLSSMVLIQQKAHGSALKKLFDAQGVKTIFIAGENDQDERKRALAKLANREIDVLIGSTILDVGVDVPAVGMVILAGGGKAEVALRQRIGRGLRAKKKGPNIAHVVDFSDGFNDHLKQHSLQRQRIVNETPGFVENVLPRAQDFDYRPFSEEQELPAMPFDPNIQINKKDCGD